MSVAALPPRKRKIALAISQDASDDDRAVKAEHETPAPALHDEEPQAKKKPTRQGYRIARKKPTLTSPAAAEPEAVQASPPSARVKEEPARQERRGSPGEAARRFGSGSWQAPLPPPAGGPPGGDDFGDFGDFGGFGSPRPPPSGGPPSPPSAQAHAKEAAQAAAARLASRLTPLSELPRSALPTPTTRPNSKVGPNPSPVG